MSKDIKLMTAAEQQAYLEELEVEYRQLQLGLSDTILLNGQLESKIDNKEKELIEKEVHHSYFSSTSKF